MAFKRTQSCKNEVGFILFAITWNGELFQRCWSFSVVTSSYANEESIKAVVWHV